MIFVSLGSNMAGTWGAPEETLREAVARINGSPLCHVMDASSLYATAGVGPGRPAVFANAIVAIQSHLPPAALLMFLKRMERGAGARSAMRWGPRSLDLDIVDYRGRIAGWARGVPEIASGRGGWLVLPHPRAHERAFVLEPLTEIAPDWRHPVFGMSGKRLLSRIAHLKAGRVIGKLNAS